MYKKLHKLLSEYLGPKVEIVSNVDIRLLSGVPTHGRIPERQLLIEMASLVKEQMTEVLGSEMKSVIRPLPKFSPDYKPGAKPLHTRSFCMRTT